MTNQDVIAKRDQHIVDTHFYARLTKLVAKYQGQSKCPFDQQCSKNIYLMSQYELITHVAIDHKLIEKFIKELTNELKKFGSSFKTANLKCPYNQNETCSKEKTPFQLIQHVVDHCSGQVRN